MPFLRTILFFLFISISTHAFGAQPDAIDRLVEDAISHGLISGGVVLVGNRHGTLFQKAYGRVFSSPDSRATTIDTIFDLASLTKVVATTPSILKLAEAGRLSLTDPVVKWFPELAGYGKEQILVYHLLTHTSGLDDFPLSEQNAMASVLSGVASQRIKGELGSRFKYADVNFMLLAELVRRAAGSPLDVYAAASFYRPLGMNDAAFRPSQKERCAPTVADDRVFLGEPQDGPCRRLGGVAGHAGLFASAPDLARFCRMMLGQGELEGTRVLAARTVEQMTAHYFSRGGQVVRGLGWDVASPYSAPRGSGFSDFSFGHTGYSGTSIWIDPASDLFVILLTSRLEYRNVREFNRLRADLSTIASALFRVPPELREMTHLNDE